MFVLREGVALADRVGDAASVAIEMIRSEDRAVQERIVCQIGNIAGAARHRRVQIGRASVAQVTGRC